MPLSLKAPTPEKALFSTREKVILLNGSKLNGCKFWPWENDPSPAEFEGEIFYDSTELHLSKEQLELFDIWKSVADVDVGSDSAQTRSPVDLVQDVTSDCSVVASLCAVTARSERLGQESCILTDITFPKGTFPANRKFVFKLNFNGCNRKVEIDDQLPTSKTERALHVFDRKNPNVHWPALIEKAYLKVRGGYDFPGSNSGTDLWILTGWIPEQVFLQSEEIVPSALWKRLFTAFNYGDVLTTIGTGKLSTHEERGLGLASEHAYAIIGMKQDGSRRLFHIKNPWSHGGVWKGVEEQEDSDSVTGTKHAHEATTPGTFWMDLNLVLQNFTTIYLNWNPGLFGHRYDVHFTWDIGARSPPESFTNNPQYLLRSHEAGSVWLLLSKHFQTFSRAAMDKGTADPRLHTGFLSLYAFERRHRIVLASGALLRAPYVDAPNILLRFEMPANTSYIIVPSEQDMPNHKHTFTLSAFSTKRLAQFTTAEQRYPHCISQTGAWTMKTSGGNASSPKFSSNPQYRLDLPQTTDLAIVLETNDSELAVQVKLVWADGQRISSTLAKRDVYGDSGEYRPGCAMAEIPRVLAGRYTIVCSTFEHGQLGPFTLRVYSLASTCTLTAIPQAVEPGLFPSPLPPALFPAGVDRILAPLTVQRLTRFHATAISRDSGRPHGVSDGGSNSGSVATASPFRLALEFGQGSHAIELAATAAFDDADPRAPLPEAVRLPPRDLKPEWCGEGSPGLWLIVERLGGGVAREEIVDVEAFGSERGVSVGAWGKASDEPIERFRERLSYRN